MSTRNKPGRKARTSTVRDSRTKAGTKGQIPLLTVKRGKQSPTAEAASTTRRGQATSRMAKRAQQKAEAATAARSALKDPMTRALREIVGKQKLTADAVAAALANGAAPSLKNLRDLIDRVLVAAPDEDLDEKLWGRNPSDAELSRTQADVDRAREAALRRTLSDALTREEVAARLGISSQAVSKRTGADQLVALRYGGRWWYPRWQFTDDDVVAELHELVEYFPSALSLTTWITTPFADLDGATPAEMLRRRSGLPRVLKLAEATSAQAW